MLALFCTSCFYIYQCTHALHVSERKPRGRKLREFLDEMFGCWGKRLANRLHIKTSGTSKSIKVGTGVSLAISAIKAVHAEEAKTSLDLSQNPHHQLSHTFLLSQSSVLCIEAASRTLHHSVVALQEIATSYSSHLSELAALLELGGDGLPLAYTSSEIYDKMVQLRMDLRREKQQLAELELLFGCCRRVMENAGETAFLAGAEFSALQAGERVAAAVRAVEQALHLARMLEGNLQESERKHIERAGKAEEARSKEKPEKQKLAIAIPPPTLPSPPASHEEPKVSTYEMLISEDVKAATDKPEDDLKDKHTEEDDGLLIEERESEGFRVELEERELLTDGGGMKEKEREEGGGYRLPTF